MNIQEIANEHIREIIKNIFSKLADEEKYVILELNNQLQDKISKIDKAIEYIKKEDEWVKNSDYKLLKIEPLLEILEGKEIKEIPQFKGTLQELDNLILGDKEND